MKTNVWVKYRMKWLNLFILLFISIVSFAQDGSVIPPKPDPAVYVNDYSQWLNTTEKDQLEQQLRALYDTTSTQVVLMIRPDIGFYGR